MPIPTTLNPADKAPNATLSGGDLTVTTTTTPYSAVRSTTSKSAGNFYFEVTVNSVGGSGASSVGVALSGAALTSIVGVDTFGVGWSNYSGGSFYYNNTTDIFSIGSASAGDVFGIAGSVGSLEVWIRRNGGVWNARLGADPASDLLGLNDAGAYNSALNTILTGPLFAMVSVYDNSELTLNFGATAFAYTPPVGFPAWDAAPSPSGQFFMGQII